MPNKKVNKSLHFRKTSSNTPYFEGFYFKLLNEQGDIIIVIAGISISKKSEYAFIQIASSLNKHTKLHKFSISLLENSKIGNGFKIENNKFSLDKIILNLDIIQLDITICNRNDWKSNFINPTIMGVLSFIPKVECKHDVLTMNSVVTGTVQFNNRVIKFDNGKGYIEKSWGKSFPDEYIWLHANQFSYKDLSVQFAIAKPKWMTFTPKVYIGYVLFHKTIHIGSHRFSQVKVIRHKEEFYITIKKLTKIIYIHIKTKEPVKLLGPNNGEIRNMITEYLKSEIELIIVKRNLFSKNAVILKDISKLSTSEIHNYI